METIEQKEIRLTVERYNKARAKYSFEEIAKVYGCRRQNVQDRQKSLYNGKIFKPTLNKLNKAMDKLGIPTNEGE